MTEDQARAVTLLQAFESAAEGALWTAEDRLWATRAAQQSVPDEASADRFVAERARLASQRLSPRDAGVQRALSQRLWSPLWTLAALGAGCVVGLVSDTLVAGPYFNLLSPLFWGLLVWNGALYAGMAAMALRRSTAGPLRSGLARALQRSLYRIGRSGPLADFAAPLGRRGLAAQRAARDRAAAPGGGRPGHRADRRPDAARPGVRLPRRLGQHAAAARDLAPGVGLGPGTGLCCHRHRATGRGGLRRPARRPGSAGQRQRSALDRPDGHRARAAGGAAAGTAGGSGGVARAPAGGAASRCR